MIFQLVYNFVFTGMYCRINHAYVIGAQNFVLAVGSVLGDTDMVICQCTECHNLDRYSSSEVVFYLVTKGMDEGYKIQRDWYHHGEVNSKAEVSNVNQCNDEIVGLYKAVEYLDEELASKVTYLRLMRVRTRKKMSFLQSQLMLKRHYTRVVQTIASFRLLFHYLELRHIMTSPTMLQ